MVFTTLDQAGQVLDQLLQLIAQIDLLSGAFALFIFWKVGDSAVQHKPALRHVGLGLGLLGFCSFLVRIWLTSGLHTGADLVNATLRALLCSGFLTSVAWMLLVIVAFLYHHVLSAGTFLRRL